MYRNLKGKKSFNSAMLTIVILLLFGCGKALDPQTSLELVGTYHREIASSETRDEEYFIFMLDQIENQKYYRYRIENNNKAIILDNGSYTERDKLITLYSEQSGDTIHVIHVEKEIYLFDAEKNIVFDYIKITDVPFFQWVSISDFNLSDD
ncbi:MAG: recombination protein O N-terminal domain-containing protein [Dethiosulfatibacter sp.]|nr:recombination protein O N-terminal domain-containing protein [Dethiosulfatibacter sp.]